MPPVWRDRNKRRQNSAQITQDGPDLHPQLWQILAAGVPKHFIREILVGMADDVSHAGNLPPRYSRILIPQLGWHPLGALADQLHHPLEGSQSDGVGDQCLKLLASDQRVGFIDEISQLLQSYPRIMTAHR